MENVRLFAELICLNGKIAMRLIKKSWLYKYVYTDIEIPQYFYDIKNVRVLENAMREVALLSLKMKHKWTEFDLDRIRYSQFIGMNYGGKIIISSINEASMISLMKELNNGNGTYINLNGLNEKSVLVDSYITIEESTATVRAKIYSFNGTFFADYSHKYFVPEEYHNYGKAYLSDVVLNWFIGDLRAHTIKDLIMGEIDKIDVCEVSNRLSIIEY